MFEVSIVKYFSMSIFSISFIILKTSIKSPLNLRLVRLNKFSSLRRSSYGLFHSLGICLFCNKGTSTVRNTPDGV